jgi:hypothetical protein
VSESWSDDERLWAELSDAAREAEDVPSEWRAAASGAFAWRTVDAELLALAEESAGATVRGDTTVERRVLEFRGSTVGLVLELGPEGAEGQLLASVRGVRRLTRTPLDAEPEEVAVDASGYFSFPVRAAETFRLRLDVGGSAHVTEWITP